jgi:hypothetical protein
VDEWKTYRPRRTPFAFGWGYGADLGGLSQQPRAGSPEQGTITYPFTSYDGKVSFERQKTGERTFDYTTEGVAHYGLYAEWFEDLRRLGGEQIARDMWDGAEAYLQMWERATGVPAGRCAPSRARLTRRGRGPLRLGSGWRGLLRRAGQPQQRTRAWTWCVKGKGNRRAADVAVLARSGRVGLVGSTARGRVARGVRVGQRRRGSGIVLRGRFAHVIRDGRVRAVAVASRSLASKPRAHRAAVRRLLKARAVRRPRVYQPSRAEQESGGRLAGRPLAGTGNERLNASLEALCRLQLQGA